MSETTPKQAQEGTTALPSLHLARLLREGGEVSGRGEIAAFDDPALLLVAPASWQASIVHTSEQSFWLSGRVTAKLALECSRCLDPVEKTVRAGFEGLMRYDNRIEVPRLELEDEDEVILFGKPDFDLTQIMVENLLSELPIKVLCRKDCQGLCSRCGSNRNRLAAGVCAENLPANDCPVLQPASTETSSPFAALKNLL
jgi:uncharacterized protein